MANLLGFKLFEGNVSLQGDLEMLAEPPVPDLETALATALKARGDYLASRASLEAQAKNVDAAKSGHWPTVSLQGAYGGRWAAGATTGTAF